jgi:UDP-N-acetyl-D-galactosamine dehydrogenase
MGIDTQDVLKAASTKWNFLPFNPGLVGGHCIGVDPYYLARCAQSYGYNPEIILAGRRLNDGMGGYVVQQVIKIMIKKHINIWNSTVLVLGFTFKENCPDVRNTKVIDIINALKEYYINVTIYDPWANIQLAENEFGIAIENELPVHKYDAVILAVAHEKFKKIDVEILLKKKHVVFDVKGFLERDIIDGRL